MRAPFAFEVSTSEIRCAHALDSVEGQRHRRGLNAGVIYRALECRGRCVAAAAGSALDNRLGGSLDNLRARKCMKQWHRSVVACMPCRCWGARHKEDNNNRTNISSTTANMMMGYM